MRDGAIDESSAAYFGWRVVVACFLMALACWGFGLYGHAVYLAELTRLYGWPPSLIAGASTATYLLNAFLVIFTSNALARFGARRFVLFGLAALALSVVLLALARQPWQVYAAYLVMSFGWLGLGLVTIPTIISQWFTRKRGLAISLALNGASFGGIVVAPALVALIGLTGFTSAMLIAAAVTVAILVPAIFLWIPPQATPAQQVTTGSSWTRRDALHSVPFWTVSGPFALALIAQVAFIVHQIAFMEPIVGRAQAALSVSLMTTFAVIGRLTLGAVVDRLDPRLISSVSMFSQAAALFVMTRTTDTTVLLTCCALYGFSVGNIITLPALIVQREFPNTAFGMVLGLSTAIGTFAGAIGPGLIGLIRDAAGDYSPALLVCMALKIVGGSLVLVRKR
ncbi:MAG TPA: MFS transporter [Xanthobacteraceae bacterium]|nr:MFS transporter [Xanthobacteraceae bacterium]